MGTSLLLEFMGTELSFFLDPVYLKKVGFEPKAPPPSLADFESKVYLELSTFAKLSRRLMGSLLL